MKKWNVMLLVGEDTGRSHGCYGHEIARTPAIDQLAQEGVRFTKAFSTAPVCAPSRSTLVTGKYAFSIGSHHMRSTLLEPPRLFTQELRDAGYHVNWANKTDFNFKPPEGFADETEEWIDALAAGKYKDQAWFLYHNFAVTHESTMWRDHWEKVVATELSEDERCSPDDVPVPAYLPDDPGVREDIARYYDSLAVQDKQVAQALEALDKSGQRDNTIVIYMSDHGRGLVREKRWCYEAGTHLPLIVRWPGVLEGGKVCEDLVSWVDMAPTILTCLGVPVPEDYQGKVFMDESGLKSPNQFCFAGRDRMDEAFDRVRSVRSDRFLYIRNYYPGLPYAQRNLYMEKQDTTRILRTLWSQGKLTPAQNLWMSERKPEEELYDCDADPENVHNLAADGEYEETLQEMRGALDDLQARVGDLGGKTEWTLITENLVEDRLEEFRERIEPLPEEFRMVLRQTVLEMPT